ncbi:MAG: hypothetical protein K0S45_1318 [Nitrospira sp.]|nr:hypothetical protein [Nitrospira sp.]
MSARQPANNPPPKIVVPKERTAPGPATWLAPEIRSRTPPCTIKTAKVMRQPMQNHHKNARTNPHDSMLENSATALSDSVLTLAEPCQAVKQSALSYSFGQTWFEHEPAAIPGRGFPESDFSIRDAKRPTPYPRHYQPSPDRELLHCLPRPDNWPLRMARISSGNSSADS